MYFEIRCLGKLASIDILSDQSRKECKNQRKIYPERVNWDSYKEIVETDFNTYAEKIDILSNVPLLENIDVAVNSLSDSLYNAASVNTIRQEAEALAPIIQDPILVAADYYYYY